MKRTTGAARMSTRTQAVDHLQDPSTTLRPIGMFGLFRGFRVQYFPIQKGAASYPAIDLKTARQLGSKALRAVAEGRDPGLEKIQARAARADSIESIVDQFLERHYRRANRTKTAHRVEQLLQLHVLSRWRGRVVGEITRRDILDVLDQVVDSGAPIQANRVLAAVRKLFNWCL